MAVKAMSSFWLTRLQIADVMIATEIRVCTVSVGTQGISQFVAYVPAAFRIESRSH